MKKILILFCLLLIATASHARKKVLVILVAGQSNADGRVPLAELPDEYKSYCYCQWSYGSGDFETATGQFVPYAPRVAKPGIERSWGFDAVVYKKLEELWQKPFYVIKHLRQHLYEVTGKKKYLRLPVICGTYAKNSRQRSQQV